MTWASLLLVGAAGGALALGATTTWASAQGDEADICEWFVEFAEGYPELEFIECASTPPRQYAGEARVYGLLSWDGRVAAFDGAVKEGGWFNWGLDQEEGCRPLQGWLEDQGLGYALNCYKSRFEGRASLQYDTYPATLEFHLVGVLRGAERSLAYYEARFTPALVLQEITIWALNGDPSFTYTAPPNATPSPAETGTGLAPPGYFIPQIALNARWGP